MTTTRYSIPSHVVTREVSGELVLLDLRSGTYHGLDPVGATLWRHLAAGTTVADACQAMLVEYDVTPQKLQDDVDALVTHLEAEGLLQAT